MRYQLKKDTPHTYLYCLSVYFHRFFRVFRISWLPLLATKTKTDSPKNGLKRLQRRLLGLGLWRGWSKILPDFYRARHPLGSESELMAQTWPKLVLGFPSRSAEVEALDLNVPN